MDDGPQNFQSFYGKPEVWQARHWEERQRKVDVDAVRNFMKGFPNPSLSLAAMTKRHGDPERFGCGAFNRVSAAAGVSVVLAAKFFKAAELSSICLPYSGRQVRLSPVFKAFREAIGDQEQGPHGEDGRSLVLCFPVGGTSPMFWCAYDAIELEPTFRRRPSLVMTVDVEAPVSRKGGGTLLGITRLIDLAGVLR